MSLGDFNKLSLFSSWQLCRGIDGTVIKCVSLESTFLKILVLLWGYYSLGVSQKVGDTPIFIFVALSILQC